MISTNEALRPFKRIRPLQSLADLVFMIDFLEPGKPFILNKDGTIMSVFELKGIEYESLDPVDIEEIERELRVFVEQVNEDFTLTNYFIRKKAGKLKLDCRTEAQPVIRYLQDKKEAFYNSLEQETFSSTIICTLKLDRPLIKKTGLSYFTAPNRLFRMVKGKLLENLRKSTALYNLARTSLANLGFREPGPEEIFSHFFYLINAGKDIPAYRPDLSLNAQLARSAYSFKGDHFLVNDTYRRVVAMTDEPPETRPMFFQSLFDFPGDIVVKNSFSTLDYEKFNRRLNANYKISKALLFKKILSGVYVSQYEENQYQVERERRRPFFHNMSVMVGADNVSDLDKSCDHLVAAVCKSGAHAGIERGYLPPAALSFFPGQEFFSKRKHYVVSSNVSNLLVKGKLSRGDSSPLEYFLDRSGNFYGFNPFSSGDAPHMIISGSTGRGKSYLLIKILLSFLALDCRIIALDRSLESFFQFLQEVDPENTAMMRVNSDQVDMRFNPFLVGSSRGVTEEQMALCEGLLTIILEKHIDAPRRYLLRQSLEQFFEEYRTVLSHSAMAIPPMDLLVSILGRRFRDRGVENALRLWTRGDRAEILNTGIDNLKGRKYCLFDLSGIREREDILRVVSYLLFSRIEEQVTDEKLLSVPKVLAIDEARYYYEKKELSPFLDKYIRQGRKNNLCVMLNFQSINDAMETDDAGHLKGWSKGLFENTQKFVLFARQLKIGHALDELNLNEAQKELYDNLDSGRREFMLVSRGGGTRVLSPVTGPWTNVIATSHPREREYRSRLKEECGGFIETIEKFVEVTGGSLVLEERLKKLEVFFKGREK